MKRVLCAILTVFLLFLFVFPVTATSEEKWEVSEDLYVITHGNTVYEKYELPGNVNYLPNNEVYLYEVENEDNYDYVAVNKGNKDIIKLHHANEIYATEEGKAILDKFKKGEYSFYLFYSDGNIVKDFAQSDFSMFIKEENKTEIDVTSLWNNNIHEVRGFDETGVLAHDCGAVYEISGEYYYIHYDSLDNSYFDAYGYFSYRQGMAPAYKLDDTAVKFVEDAKFSSEFRMEEYIYPDEEWFVDEDDNLSATITFWVISVLFGLIIPAILLVLSLVFANSKKAINPKKWYILTVCSVLWILTGVGIVLTFIL